jgi:serine/threonine protein kinase
LTPERWAQIEDLFHRAAECALDSRPSLLDKECADDLELRREVEALLASENDASDHMQAAVRSAADTVAFPLVGQTISHYHIMAGLGGGGMGLVYRAEDIKLGRQVALKFLPEESASDSAALGRFEREARSASALEHPNICPIYEFGEHEGQPFLAMQLLEGQTLRELLASAAPGRPAFSLQQLIDLAAQIADGLGAAHQKSIIHRDIKPANIFVTKQGLAKILDFGLAKLSSREVQADDAEFFTAYGGGPTEPLREAVSRATPDPLLSRTGVAMGTAAYMSPEQARGEKLDARTDLFSFGLVLYEMATGQRAFREETGPLLRDAILSQDPISLSQLNPKVPAKLGKIITKLLAKDRAARYASAADIRADLQKLKNEAGRTSHRWKIAGGLTLVLLIISGLWIYETRAHRSEARREPKLTQLTVNSFENKVNSGAISPNGKYLAYANVNGMFLKSIETGTARAVSQPEEFKGKKVEWEILSMAWFPNSGSFIANCHPATEDQNSTNTSVWMIPVSGDPPRKLRSGAVAWSVAPDGSSIAVGSNKGPLGEREIWLMSPRGELRAKVLEADEGSAIVGFVWAPQGHRALYVRTNKSGDTLLSHDLNGGPPSTIFSPLEMKNMLDVAWLPDGRLLYSLREPAFVVEACNFWTVRLDSTTGRFLEKPRKLTSETTSCKTDLSVTSDGKRLAFVKWTSHMISYMADLNAGGTRIVNIRHFPASESSDGLTSWTPDGKQVLLVSDRAGTFGVYQQALDQETAQPLVTQGSGGWVTPDGKWVLYFGLGDDREPTETRPRAVMRVPATGGKPEALFTARPWSVMSCARSPSELCAIAESTEDRTQEVITSVDPVNGRGTELARIALDPNDNSWFFALSWDGTRIAATQTATGPIYVLPVHGQGVQQIKLKGWDRIENFTWAADGRWLFVVVPVRGGAALLHVDLQGNAHVLWEHIGAVNDTSAAPSPDGRHVAIQTWTQAANIWLMEDF